MSSSSTFVIGLDLHALLEFPKDKLGEFVDTVRKDWTQGAVIYPKDVTKMLAVSRFYFSQYLIVVKSIGYKGIESSLVEVLIRLLSLFIPNSPLSSEYFDMFMVGKQSIYPGIEGLIGNVLKRDCDKSGLYTFFEQVDRFPVTGLDGLNVSHLLLSKLALYGIIWQNARLASVDALVHLFDGRFDPMCSEMVSTALAVEALDIKILHSKSPHPFKTLRSGVLESIKLVPSSHATKVSENLERLFWKHHQGRPVGQLIADAWTAQANQSGVDLDSIMRFKSKLIRFTRVPTLVGDLFRNLSAAYFSRTKSTVSKLLPLPETQNDSALVEAIRIWQYLPPSAHNQDTEYQIKAISIASKVFVYLIGFLEVEELWAMRVFCECVEIFGCLAALIDMDWTQVPRKISEPLWEELDVLQFVFEGSRDAVRTWASTTLNENPEYRRGIKLSLETLFTVIIVIITRKDGAGIAVALGVCESWLQDDLLQDFVPFFQVVDMFKSASKFKFTAPQLVRPSRFNNRLHETLIF